MRAATDSQILKCSIETLGPQWLHLGAVPRYEQQVAEKIH